MVNFDLEEKRLILGNEKDYPNLASIIKAQNHYKFYGGN